MYELFLRNRGELFQSQRNGVVLTTEVGLGQRSIWMNCWSMTRKGEQRIHTIKVLHNV
jgi:hypothetical protein